MKNKAIFDSLVGVIREKAKKGDFPASLIDKPITPQTTLAELGLDSLGHAVLLTTLMDITNKYFPDEFFHGARTMQEIVDHAA